MTRSRLDEIESFVEIARERSFRRAAAKLGVSASALSHSMNALEERLGVRLLNRTTRSVAPTDAGARLMATVAPRLDEIAVELDGLNAFRDRPSGAIRLNAGEHAVRTVLWPRLDRFLRDHPDIRIDVTLENALADIVADGFDAGVRLGEQVARDMIAVRIGPDWRMAVVGTPEYFATHPVPATPHDLTRHRCINLRLASYGGYYAWEFERNRQKLNVRVEGQLAFSSSTPILEAALAGHGLACIPEDMALSHIATGTLKRVLTAWCPTFVGYHLYYPSRKHPSPAFALLVEALRWRG